MVRKLLNKIEDVDNLLTEEHFKKSKLIAFDTETTSKRIEELDIVGYSFAYKFKDEVYSYYVPISHCNKGESFFEEPVVNLPRLKALLLLDYLTVDKSFVMHNSVFDLSVVNKLGYNIFDIEMDTMIMAVLVNENNLRNPGVGLKKLSAKYLNHNMIDFETVSKGDSFKYVNLSEAVNYATDDVIQTLELYQFFLNEYKANPKLENLWLKIEKEMIYILSDMYIRGVTVDATILKKIGKETEKIISNIEKEIYEITDKTQQKSFNIASVKQIQNVLVKMGATFPDEFMTQKGNISLNEDNLDKLHKLTKDEDIRKFIDLLLRHRAVNKIKNTYTDSLIKQIKKDRIHTSFRSLGAVTGRLTSSNPNLQNLPTTKDGFGIKKFIVADKNSILLDFDYSQIELRLLAHCSKDDTMLYVYNNKGDIHKETMEACNCKTRTEAKGINFGIMYGMGAKSLSEDINVSLGDAKKYLESIKKKYPKVFNYKNSVENFFKSNGYINNLFGRKRSVQLKHPITVLQELEKRRYNTLTSEEKRMFGEYSGVLREVFNCVIQGSSADLLKLAMIKIFKYIQEKGNDKLYILLSVHDEILINCPLDIKEEVKNDIKTIMETVVSLRIPLEVDCSEGLSWYECKKG